MMKKLYEKILEYETYGEMKFQCFTKISSLALHIQFEKERDPIH